MSWLPINPRLAKGTVLPFSVGAAFQDAFDFTTCLVKGMIPPFPFDLPVRLPWTRGTLMGAIKTYELCPVRV